MKHRQRQPSDKRKLGKVDQEQRKNVQTKKKSDALMKEVEETNAHITNPTERERVIPSKPC